MSALDVVSKYTWAVKYDIRQKMIEFSAMLSMPPPCCI